MDNSVLLDQWTRFVHESPVTRGKVFLCVSEKGINSENTSRIGSKREGNYF